MVVVRRNSPVLIGHVLLRVVFLVESEEGVEVDALLEVVDGLKTADVLHEVEVAERVHASADHPVPVHALQLDVGVVFLELEVKSLSEVDVGTLNRVHVLAIHCELVELEILWENFHFCL